MKKVFSILFLCLLLSFLSGIAAAEDGTVEGACVDQTDVATPAGAVNATDDVYVITPFESVSISQTSTWQDNRHRAYWSSSLGNVNGFLLFDVSQIPDDAQIVSMTLRCYLENAYGSPSNNPVVDVYYSADDGWTRYSAGPGSLSLDALLVNDVPFSTWTYSYDFILDVTAHDWTQDLLDDQICIGFTNDVNYYSYVYFFDAYGTPSGPPPELTIETSTGGGPYDIFVDLTYVGGSPVPATGGNLFFEVFVENQDTVPAIFDGWLAVEYEGGPPTTLASRFFSGFMPGWTINRPDMFYPIPGSWSAGNYTFWGRVGDEPGDVWAEDGFPFVKSGVSDGAEFTPYPVAGAPNPFDVIETGEKSVANEYQLLENYPNPFNPTTMITYSLPNSGNVTLSVYDVSGREVATLVNGWRDAGVHEAVFDASDLPSGIYVYRLSTKDMQVSGKMVLVK
jgi:hypothetical protein